MNRLNEIKGINFSKSLNSGDVDFGADIKGRKVRTDTDVNKDECNECNTCTAAEEFDKTAERKHFCKLFKRFIGFILMIFTAVFLEILFCIPAAVSYPLVFVYFIVQVMLWI